MESFLNIEYTWGQFFLLAFLLVILNIFIQNSTLFLGRIGILGRYQRSVRYYLRFAKLLFEPAAALILVSAFVLINPAFHGTFILLFLIGAFRQLRDYVSSRFIGLDPAISVGNRLRIGEEKGVITAIGRLGIRLKTRKGIFYQTYSNMLNKGYVQVSGEEIGGFYFLKLKPQQPDKTDHKNRLFDLLATAPYLDKSHKPELRLSEKNQGQINARILVKEKRHLYDLLALIKEWGYSCTIDKK